jgi:hypothetical protein
VFQNESNCGKQNRRKPKFGKLANRLGLVMTRAGMSSWFPSSIAKERLRAYGNGGYDTNAQCERALLQKNVPDLMKNTQQVVSLRLLVRRTKGLPWLIEKSRTYLKDRLLRWPSRFCP